MDLSKFDTRQKAEAGVEVPLEIDGETQYSDEDGEPIVFTIKGMADESVHKAILQAKRSDNRTPKEVIQADMKLARLAVTGWSSNFTIEGEKLEYSRANIEKVFANPVVRAAVLSKVFDTHNFMNGS